MKRACLVLLTVCGVGCAAVAETASDITTVSVGSDSLKAVQIEQSVKLVDQPVLPACLPISLDLPDRNAVVALQPSAAGCALVLTQSDLVLLDKAEIEKARDQAGPFDVNGIKTISVSLMKLDLKTGEGATLPLDEYADAVTVEVDGDVLLDKVAPDALQSGETLKRKLPDALVDKLKGAVKSGQAATADIVLTLWLRGAIITNVPSALSFTVTLQPELEVSLLDAL
jgi:hypothetical protein